MTITREQVADLQPGDVVELSWPTTSGHEGVTMTARGPLRSISGHTPALFLGCYAVRDQHSSPVYGDRRTLTVVSRAPRPLYVNHPRTEPVPSDVMRREGDEKWRMFGYSGEAWVLVGGTHMYDTEALRDQPLRLLVDGETGQVVPS